MLEPIWSNWASSYSITINEIMVYHLCRGNGDDHQSFVIPYITTNIVTTFPWKAFLLLSTMPKTYNETNILQLKTMKQCHQLSYLSIRTGIQDNQRFSISLMLEGHAPHAKLAGAIQEFTHCKLWERLLRSETSWMITSWWVSEYWHKV